MTVQPQNSGFLSDLQNYVARKGRRAWPLTVLSKSRIAPRMTRVEFLGSDLDEFVWTRGQDVVLELPAPEGIARRRYTVRAHDPVRRTLSIDFFLHGEGASGPWLDSLRNGDAVNAVGPRGHTYLREADWHLFVGDETCIPGIFAMLEELGGAAPAYTFLEVGSTADQVPLDASAKTAINWVTRNGNALFDAVENFALPKGEGFATVIGETAKVRAIRHRLLERGIARNRIAAEGYWRPGRVGGHDHV
ncbi:MAG TPA: siderophore-interacting protein [Rhizomicrobium sp.]|nr:siderophore-interacting protein [Rhizomicrobium sp.]